MAQVVTPGLVHRQTRELGRVLPRAMSSGAIQAADLRDHWVVPVPGETDQEFLYRLSWRYQKLADRYGTTPIENRPPEFWGVALSYARHHRRQVRRFWIWVALGILVGTVLGFGAGPLGVTAMSVVGSMAGVVAGNVKTGPRRPRHELADELAAAGDGEILASNGAKEGRQE